MIFSKRHSLKFIGAAVVSAFAFGTMAVAQAPSFPVPDGPETVPGQFIIKTQPGAATENFPIGVLGGETRVIDTLPVVGALVVEVDPNRAQTEMSSTLSGAPGFEYVEPVYVVYASAEPNDPDYGGQWAWPKISAPEAWETRTDGSSVVVGVVDTGVDYLHPDLKANMWINPGEMAGNGLDDDNNGVIDDVYGANFVPNVTSGDPMDDNRHGTHVAGTIGAVTDNNLGVAGVNWDAQIMALKFLNANGSGSTVGAIRAIEYGIKMDVDILNNSWGGGGFSQALEDAIKLANDKGILFVAAAGNGGADQVGDDNDASPHYPSNYDVPNVMSVMATNEVDAPTSFSNFGQRTVDIAAPGANILSTIPGGGYDAFNGTSMATPHVAGAAALMLAEDPTLTHLQLKERLMDTVDLVPALTDFNVSGGRLNLARAMGGGDGGGEPEVCDTSTHTQIAYEQFLWSDNKRFDANSNVISVDLTLPERMVIDISAHTSARRIAGSGVTPVRTGVYSLPSTGAMWTASYRRVNFNDADENSIVSSDMSIVLPAGQHTIYWKLWISGATVQLDSGTLTVRGIPCVMGGGLGALATADSADVTEAVRFSN